MSVKHCTGDTVTSVELQKQKAQEFNQNWSLKKVHGQFVRKMSQNVDRDKT